MKARPILFSAPMVQAILSGTKTQTRRVVKDPEKMEGLVNAGEEGEWCPYGRVGDVLWVRETYRQYENGNIYRASIPYGNLDCHFKPWKPSIFMPKNAARIFLKITGVRIERLQDISEADAISEGIEFNNPFYRDYHTKKNESRQDFEDTYKYNGRSAAYMSYRTLWESINGFSSWDENPWVWVIEFERIEKTASLINQ